MHLLGPDDGHAKGLAAPGYQLLIGVSHMAGLTQGQAQFTVFTGVEEGGGFGSGYGQVGAVGLVDFLPVLLLAEA